MYIFQHMSYVPKPQFWSRIGSPWLGSGSNSARTNPTASRNLLKILPALRQPVFGPKSKKTSIYGKLPIKRPISPALLPAHARIYISPLFPF